MVQDSCQVQYVKIYDACVGYIDYDDKVCIK